MSFCIFAYGRGGKLVVVDNNLAVAATLAFVIAAWVAEILIVG